MKIWKLVTIIVTPFIIAGLVLSLGYYYLSSKLFLPWQQDPTNNQPDLFLGAVNQNEVKIFEEEKRNLPHEEKVQGAEKKKPPTEVIVANYFDGLQKPRLMTLDPYGNIIVSDIKADAVYAIVDDNHDFRADRQIEIISGLNNPHGLAFWGNDLYIAETDKVRVLRGLEADYSYTDNKVIIDNLTNKEGHFTRTIQIIGDKLYLSIGSSCNVCLEKNNNRAKMLRYDLDGTNRQEVAKGLRNTVGFVQSPFDGKIYGTDNGRDWLGDNLPPDEINKIELGKDYGWPFCYGDKIHDLDFDKNNYIQDPCQNTEPPIWELGAHQAPLGLRFYQGEMFKEIEGDLLVALHGSWNSSVPVGYKIVRIDFNPPLDNTKEWIPVSESDFLNIFITENGEIKGRPVDILIGSQGEIYITDDFAGRIYVVYKQ